MSEREELATAIKAAVSRLQPHEVEALADHLEQAGFRKTLDVPGISGTQFGLALEMASEFIERKPIASSDAKKAFVSDIVVNKMTMAIKDVVAPKERWVAAGYLFKFHDTDYIAHVSERDLASFRNGDSWIEIGQVFMESPSVQENGS